mmetsp:Transcript_19713/g.50086  ORF Transcript_19713/g.50086 Transcript_19713/m.50086 type:complete len:208 (+) Transcript_19713:395-1018(+)
MTFAPLRPSATATMSNHSKLSRSSAPNAKSTQSTGGTSSPTQKTVLSSALVRRCDISAHSKRHSLLPSGSISFHQRRPTSNLPETFFTVQKSKASSSTVMMKLSTNDEETHVQKTYVRMAAVRKKRWKKATCGCSHCLSRSVSPPYCRLVPSSSRACIASAPSVLVADSSMGSAEATGSSRLRKRTAGGSGDSPRRGWRPWWFGRLS